MLLPRPLALLATEKCTSLIFGVAQPKAFNIISFNFSDHVSFLSVGLVSVALHTQLL